MAPGIIPDHSRIPLERSRAMKFQKRPGAQFNVEMVSSGAYQEPCHENMLIAHVQCCWQ